MNVVELKGVSVCYRERRVRSLKEAVVSAFRPHEPPPAFYSLREVSTTIRHGEAVGIIGSNGAGKSTLLRVAAGIIRPSEGMATRRGTIAPVLELGTGFEWELSGRENIVFNGTLLGFSRAFMRSRQDEIVAFSGLGEVIDLPLRTYSTGMIARLAFAVATAIDAETILLDEILAVGDATFQALCATRIARYVRSGAAIVLVSHDLTTIEAMCSRAIWLSHGQIVADGPSAEVVATYRLESGSRSLNNG
jgi:ABC-2 type transport system ATP-binding protein